jgi:malate dehydrogenase (oxaloacetate-decarboxylating)(NADP+)
MKIDLRTAALNYHAQPVPGKISVVATKPTQSQMDLSLCYTPGVAEPVIEIAKNKEAAYLYTAKGNLVAVITNGSAVLGLGNMGALASKPVMEGKGVLFKHFADIDVFDIEVACDDPDKFIETVIHISPTFGGINLEDIKAPECFYIEQILRERLDIPVFHDDQHGTAIVAAAGLLNALLLQNKKLEEAVIVCVGAGAAGIATMRLLLAIGAKKDNLLMVDRLGVIHTERADLTPQKRQFAVKTDKKTLADALAGADVFIGVSGPGLMTKDMVDSMAKQPIIFAMSNPTPEIMPDEAFAVRKDLIMATGRSDYPNQVNNALCFPYIFRGALDVRATTINDEMCLAAVRSICDLAKETVLPEVLQAYNLTHLEFGPNYILPKLMDPRLKKYVSRSVAQAAIASGAVR